MGIILSLLRHFPGISSFRPDEEQALLEKSRQTYDANAAHASELRGQKMHIDMTRSFKSWPYGIRHPEYKRLCREVDRVLEIGVPDPERCKNFKKCDFALFSCLTPAEEIRWWPNASWDDLYTMMLFTVCLFVWDDIIDTNEHVLASDFEKANVWRQQSLVYFKYHLRLSSSRSGEPYCPDNICVLFKEFGQRFCHKFGKVQRCRMFGKIENFVQHNKLEQAERLAGHVPDYEQYMRIRYGVTGVRMFSLLLEIANQSALPSWVMDSTEMQVIVKECNFIIIVINDILSLKKELATECVVNVVPVLYKTGKSLDQVISYLIEEMHTSRDRLDRMAEKLNFMTNNQPQLNEDVMSFIDGIRIMDTGTLIYSIESPRYGIQKYQQHDGSLDIVL